MQNLRNGFGHHLKNAYICEKLKKSNPDEEDTITDNAMGNAGSDHAVCL